VTDDGAGTAPLQPMMPPRRGWGIFGLGFYNDVTPTALGKRDSIYQSFLINIKVAFATIATLAKCLQIIKDSLAASVPRFDMIHF